MNSIGTHNIQYKEYLNEIPLNTIRSWESLLMKKFPWEYIGWSGPAKEPFRHWACYPEFDTDLKQIWDTINFSLVQDGFNLNIERIVANLFSHGDSSWLHKDCDSDTAWTVILYLNPFWDPNWHGGTVLMEGQEALKYFSPSPGKFIIFKSNLLHGATPVSREAAFPRFGLTFQTETVKNDKDLQGFSKNKLSALSPEKL